MDNLLFQYGSRAALNLLSFPPFTEHHSAFCQNQLRQWSLTHSDMYMHEMTTRSNLFSVLKPSVFTQHSFYEFDNLGGPVFFWLSNA